MSNVEKELEELRDEISKLDSSIVELLNSRAALAKRIGAAKIGLGRSVIDRAREQEVYERITSEDLENLTKSQLLAIYKEIIAACRVVQAGKKRVAFLGPAGTFSEQATKSYFSEAEADFIMVNKISDVFRRVISEEVDYGVVPVENSTYGSVPVTLDLLLESDIKAIGEIIIRIKHNLITLKKIPLSEIKTVLSKDQAIAQCRGFIEENLPTAEIIETKSTSRAVEVLPEYENAAAIGTELAAEIFNRVVISKGIEDNQNNFTRFFVLGHEESTPTDTDKTSIVFSVKHVPGALLNALKAFSSRKINLTKLESRPSRITPWEYYFYTDFEGHIAEPHVQEALADLKNNTLYIKILGSYKSSK
ncbi:MAG: prephenate dehydratase [Candidatus Helarchaeota archaeon]|nr:prephenate dehydratase [Candidatus Helarchaeota archaeon]